MSKARRSVQQEFHDVFADWSLDDQEAALRMLTETHRQAVRQEKRRKAAPAEVAAPAAPTGETGRENT
ncbi:MAG: hypothetical protein M3Y07_05425 [Acidobacteriota bacterium]|nr:hypothetical protein [Acidobacteriota bacterium]